MNKDLKKIIEILKKLMSYQTIDGKNKEFTLLFEYIKKLLPNSLFTTMYEFANKKAMVIANTQDKELDIVFCTHIDVVPDNQYVYLEDKEFIKGRGCFDMKGSVAVCLYLFSNLKTNKKIGLFITSDEELTGNCAKELLNIYNPQLAIVPDGGKNLQIVQEEKGQLQVKITIDTKSAHASQPYNGENAIMVLLNLYQQMIKKYPLPKSIEEYKTSINLSKINGGESLNSVASHAEMYLDIRHTSLNTKEQLLKDLQSIRKDIKIEILHSGSLFYTDINHPFIKKYIQISEKITKNKIEVVSSEATSDAIYFSDLHIPTILTNPVGDYAHGPNEYVKKDSLLQLYKIWKEIIK